MMMSDSPLHAPITETAGEPNPPAAYRRRLEECLKTIAVQLRLHIRYGNAKLVIIVAGLVIAWLAIYPRTVSPLWLIAPAAFYGFVAVRHNRANRIRRRAGRLAAFYQRGTARIEDRWSGTGSAGEQFRSRKSIYADDLDLFGRGSLFELLSTARTPMGETRLADWLLAPSTAATAVERQSLVAELRDKLALREDLAIAGEDLRAALDSDAVRHWAESSTPEMNSGFRWLFAALASGLVATIVIAVAAKLILPLLIVAITEIVLTIWFARRAKAALQGFEAGDQGLALLAEMLERLEKESFVAPRLQRLQQALTGGSIPASGAIERLSRLANWEAARHSLLVYVLDLPLMYTLQLGVAAATWRRSWGDRLGTWLETIGDAEALLSLATYSFEHPDDPFPILVEPRSSGAVFEGEDLGHPLLPSSACIRNSIRLGPETQVLMVSGSNMSGKSTLLRTVGINTVLAMAGAPVRARSLKLTPLVLGTSIRTTDSLQEGRSGFFTEILRLREIYGLAENGKRLLFLFDELFGGTNSSDRRAGAEGVIRALMASGAIGMVTTHDMALTRISSGDRGVIRNVHFQERIENGEMKFDYRLRPGVVEKSNALELMRIIGLNV